MKPPSLSIILRLIVSTAIPLIMCVSCVTAITLTDGAKITDDVKKELSNQNTIVWEQTMSAGFFSLLAFKKMDAIKKCKKAHSQLSNSSSANKWDSSKDQKIQVEIRRSIPNILVLLLTLGFYTPFKVRIICQSRF